MSAGSLLRYKLGHAAPPTGFRAPLGPRFMMTFPLGSFGKYDFRNVVECMLGMTVPFFFHLLRKESYFPFCYVKNIRCLWCRGKTPDSVFSCSCPVLPVAGVVLLTSREGVA